ncbi:transposase [Xenorhabdus mauleonii]|uniref:Transposase n=1 Tax=Xenorhabdus mauleonii TaxID=351675 RepID=A0A1I3KDI6_9GAMM|nr:transposase [Xenorhabdus mauleonii]SFI70444.1 hypothetical protein SAMN05421680_10349 [Xenorhabdus mauleonii]
MASYFLGTHLLVKMQRQRFIFLTPTFQGREINENSNEFIRDGFPKDTDSNKVSELEVNLIDWLNTQFRKTQGYNIGLKSTESIS